MTSLGERIIILLFRTSEANDADHRDSFRYLYLLGDQLQGVQLPGTGCLLHVCCLHSVDNILHSTWRDPFSRRKVIRSSRLSIPKSDWNMWVGGLRRTLSSGRGSSIRA